MTKAEQEKVRAIALAGLRAMREAAEGMDVDGSHVGSAAITLMRHTALHVIEASDRRAVDRNRVELAGALLGLYLEICPAPTDPGKVH